MANTPGTNRNDINKKSWLFLQFLEFLWTFPTEIKTEEDYKNFLTKLDQIEYTFRRISKRAITEKQLDDFYNETLYYFQDKTRCDPRNTYEAMIFQRVAYSLIHYWWKHFWTINAPLEKEKVDLIKNSLDIAVRWWIFKNVRRLWEVNIEAQVILQTLKVRDMPVSFLIELPIKLNDGKRIWVLYERNEETRKLLVSIFMWENEPSWKKLEIVKSSNSDIDIDWPTFRDQVWVFSCGFWLEINYTSYLKVMLGNNYDVLKALIILWIVPVTLRRDTALEVFEKYWITLKNRSESHQSSNQERLWNSWESSARNYPYNGWNSEKINGLMENEDKETNTRIVHKRLLPVLQRTDWSYISAKPSDKAINTARERWFTLSEWIWFPEENKCIYPEKIPELLKELWVNDIQEAILILNSSWKTSIIRYETLVIPATENENNLKITVKARVWNAIKS